MLPKTEILSLLSQAIDQLTPQNAENLINFFVDTKSFCIFEKTISSDMEFTAKQIAEFIQGRVEGDENATVNTFAKI